MDKQKAAQNTSISDGHNNQPKHCSQFRPNSQCGELLAMMRARGSITHYDAAQNGIMAFTARIYDLRQAGYQVIATPEKHINKHGKTITIYRYSLLS